MTAERERERERERESHLSIICRICAMKINFVTKIIMHIISFSKLLKIVYAYI